MKSKTMILLILLGFILLITACSIGSYDLNVIIEPEEGGEVIINPQPPYKEGDSVTLIANTTEGYKFISWSGDITNSINPITVTMESNMTIYANYAETPTMKILIDGTEMSSGTSNYDFGKVEVGYESAETFTVENTWGTNLNIHNISVEDENTDTSQFLISLGEQEYPVIVEPTQTITFNVIYSPTSSGLKTGVLNVFSNDLLQNPYTIGLEGTAPVWSILGNEDFSTGGAENIKLDVDSGVPYVAYRDLQAYGNISVMTYDGQAWASVGYPGFSGSTVNSISLTTYNNFPYVAYSLEQNSSIEVRTFNGSSWIDIGDTSTFNGDYVSLSTKDGNTYLTYAENSTSQPILKMYDGSAWTDIGGGSISTDGAEHLSLYIYEGETENIPYVAYKNIQTLQPIVYKYENTSWEQVSGLNINASDIRDLKVFVENGIPYLSYATEYISQPKLLMFDGSDWIYIGGDEQSGQTENEFLDMDIYLNSSNFPEPFITYTDPLNDYYGRTTAYKQDSYSSYLEDDLNGNFTDFYPNDPAVSVVKTDDGVPHTFVAYNDEDAQISGSITVKKFDDYDGSWEMIGAKGFNNSNSTDIKIKVVYNQETEKLKPYVAYRNEGNNMVYVYEATYNELDEVYVWSQLGFNPVSAGATTDIDFDVYYHYDGTATIHPYIAYDDIANSGLPTVKYFNGSIWQTVTVDSLANSTTEIALQVYDNMGTAMPYVAYKDSGNSNYLTVKYYDEIGASWVTVGSEGFTANEVQDISLDIYVNGANYNPFVGFNSVDTPDTLIPTVMMFDGTNWNSVGNQDIFPINPNDLDIAVEHDLTSAQAAPFISMKSTNKSKPFIFRFYYSTGLWEEISTTGSDDNLLINKLSIYINGTTPYIAYKEDDNNALGIKRYDGNDWVSLGDNSIADSINEAFIYVYTNNNDEIIPYLAYTDYSSKKLSIMTYE